MNKPMLPDDDGAVLGILTRTDPPRIKAFAEDLIEHLADIEVLSNRTALVMLPYHDTAGGAVFHLGEVLVAEAHVRISGGTEGYAVCVGRDLEQVLAVALIDAARAADIARPAIDAFIREQQADQAAQDDALLRDVEATRVAMETF